MQFENLVISNRHKIFERLGLQPDVVVQDGPYFQTATTKQNGCQIDYLIQTKFQTLYLFEIKFRNQINLSEVVKEVHEKMRRMKIPKGFSLRPVLIYCCTNELDSSEEFDYQFSLAEFLKA